MVVAGSGVVLPRAYLGFDPGQSACVTQSGPNRDNSVGSSGWQSVGAPGRALPDCGGELGHVGGLVVGVGGLMDGGAPGSVGLGPAGGVVTVGGGGAGDTGWCGLVVVPGGVVVGSWDGAVVAGGAVVVPVGVGGTGPSGGGPGWTGQHQSQSHLGALKWTVVVAVAVPNWPVTSIVESSASRSYSRIRRSSAWLGGSGALLVHVTARWPP